LVECFLSESFLFPGLYNAGECESELQSINFLLQTFFCMSSTQAQLIVLGGLTGSGKSLILEHLSSLSYPVIHLEALAGHRGSVFGRLGFSSPPPSQPEFESALNNIYHSQISSRFIFTESEAPSIGRIRIPSWFYQKMQEAIYIYIQIPLEARIRNILTMYEPVDETEMIMALNKLSERLTAHKLQALEKMIKEKRFYDFTEVMLEYYDQSNKYTGIKEKASLVIDMPVLDIQKISNDIQQFLGMANAA
jgi:tRNA 2-selenouridine synthase